MLAKIAPASNDFHALARYVVAGKAGTTPSPKRIAWTLPHNLPTDDPELAPIYMAATAQRSPRTKRAAYHLMIAWHQRERPSEQAMQTIARQTLNLAGLAEHQALIIGHGDKPHAHLHMLINRVHPETGRAWKTSHDFARLDRIMQQLAAEHGFEYTPAHAFNPELTDKQTKRPNSRATYAAKRGAATSRPQWSRHTARTFGERVSEHLTGASTIDDLASLVGSHGLRLEHKGKGLVVGNDHSYAKLSSLGLKFAVHGIERTKATVRARRAAPARSILDVDVVDVAKGLAAWGLLGRDDVRAAIRDATHARSERLRQQSLHKRLAHDLKLSLQATTSLTPPPTRPATPKPQRTTRQPVGR